MVTIAPQADPERMSPTGAGGIDSAAARGASGPGGRESPCRSGGFRPADAGFRPETSGMAPVLSPARAVRYQDGRMIRDRRIRAEWSSRTAIGGISLAPDVGENAE